MSQAIVIAGTDTDVGKTVFAAALTAAMGACYWKPVQAGLAGETDSEIVRRLGGLPPDRVLPEAYRLNTAASPHYAAARDGIEIDAAALNPPCTSAPLVIECAGGLAVPLTRKVLQIDVLARWRLPVVLVASTRIGTINHSLLSLEALRRRAIPILGLAFAGDEAPESARIIGELGLVRILGSLPYLDPLNAVTLRAAFAENFNVAEILGLGMGGP
ncbi:MAG: ATP-dependent dethiobiotin synthetase BioD [Hyphomicrobium sp.]|jgi:dethiobiotin synthetase|nr:ATP-dependent dethiobiotin synthetase BioD [Hyphomicrobium sp.]